MAGISDARAYAVGFISVFIGAMIAVSVLPTFLGTLDNLTGVPLLASGLVGTIAGAGILMFLLKGLF
jgi:hypothetical protein